MLTDPGVAHAVRAHGGAIALWLLLFVALAILLLIPAVRRALRNVYEQLCGVRDGLTMSNRPNKAAKSTVENKVATMWLRAEAYSHRRIMKFHKVARKRTEQLRSAQQDCEESEAALQRAQREADDDAKLGLMEKSLASRSPIRLSSYYAVQLILGIGDIVFTYFAFELWQLPTIVLVPLAVLLGLLGVILGHFCGQAIAHKKQLAAAAAALGATAQCIVLGSTRAAYLITQSSGHTIDAVSAIAAFGVPFLLVYTSILLAAHLRYPTELEKARAWASGSKRLRDAINARGDRETKRLAAELKARRDRALEVIRTYLRGFGYGWRNEPLTFPNFGDTMKTEIQPPAWPPKEPALPTSIAPPVPA